MLYRGGGRDMNDEHSVACDNISVSMHEIGNSRDFCQKNNPHCDPHSKNQYLCALDQLFAPNNTTSYTNVLNSSSCDGAHIIDTLANLNCGNYRGHYVDHHVQASSCMNVNSSNHYSFSIDTNICHQENTNVSDVTMHPDAGSNVFLFCKCQSLCNDANIDASLAVNEPVLCTLDFIESLDVIDTCQVVFLHYPRGHSSGFYQLFQNDVHIICLDVCLDKDIGPFQVCDRCVVNVSFCNHLSNHNSDSDLTPKQALDDYRKDIGSRNSYNLTYTQYIEAIIDKLCVCMDLQADTSKPQPSDASSDATDMTHIPNSFTALLHDETTTAPQVDHDAYIPSKTVGFLSHEDTVFEFIGPDRPPVHINSVEKCIEIANIIRATGLPNYKSARIPIASNLKVEASEKALSAYPDKHLLQYIKFGFPLSLSSTDFLTNKKAINLHSALQYPQAIEKYITKEKKFGTILGPVTHIHSAHYHCSPLLTRPKDTNDRRVILNLSHPRGQSLNDAVDKLNFDARPFTLKFPSVDNIVERILQVKDPLIFKINVARAFRNLRVDPVDALKFDLSWRDTLYIDADVAFGYTHGSAAFQMVADAISYIMASSGSVVNADIDDFIVVAPRAEARRHYDHLSNLLDSLGLPMNPSKKTPPCETLTCLGIVVNIVEGTLSIAPEKLKNIYQMCCEVATKKSLSKKTYQSLIGKLIYIHKCVAPARTFINRILFLFRSSSQKSRIHLTQDFFRDIQWFLKFLPAFIGVTFFRKSPIQSPDSMHLDACLSGLGAIWNQRVYSTPIIPIPNFTLTIVHLEMWNIAIALRMWGHLWRHSSIQIFCDNLAVVQVMNTHKTRDPFYRYVTERYGCWLPLMIFFCRFTMSEAKIMQRLISFPGYTQVLQLIWGSWNTLTILAPGTRYILKCFNLILTYNCRCYRHLQSFAASCFGKVGRSIQTVNYSVTFTSFQDFHVLLSIHEPFCRNFLT